MLGLLACGLVLAGPKAPSQKSRPAGRDHYHPTAEPAPLEARIRQPGQHRAVNSPQSAGGSGQARGGSGGGCRHQVKPGLAPDDVDPADLSNSKLAQDTEVARLGALADQQRRNVAPATVIYWRRALSLTPRWTSWSPSNRAIEQQWAAAKAQGQ